MKAFLKNYRQASRKVRIVADSVRGKTVQDADTQLSLMNQKAAPVLRKLIASAFANARQTQPTITMEELAVKTLTVDKGVTYTVFMPRAFGRASPINRECTHVHVALGTAEDLKKKKERKTTSKRNTTEIKK